MLIREALEAELPRVLTLLKELDEEAELSLEEARAIWKRMKQYPYYKAYVALKGMEIVGSFSLLICDNLGHGGVRFAVVDNVVVDPNYRGQGIGKKIMMKAMELARQNDCYKMMLSSNKSRVRAHEFYKKLGFEEHCISFMTVLR